MNFYSFYNLRTGEVRAKPRIVENADSFPSLQLTSAKEITSPNSKNHSNMLSMSKIAKLTLVQNLFVKKIMECSQQSNMAKGPF